MTACHERDKDQNDGDPFPHRTYQTMLSLCRSLLKSGILSQSDFNEAERCLRAKYQPIFTAA